MEIVKVLMIRNLKSRHNINKVWNHVSPLEHIWITLLNLCWLLNQLASYIILSIIWNNINACVWGYLKVQVQCLQALDYIVVVISLAHVLQIVHPFICIGYNTYTYDYRVIHTDCTLTLIHVSVWNTITEQEKITSCCFSVTSSCLIPVDLLSMIY